MQSLYFNLVVERETSNNSMKKDMDFKRLRTHVLVLPTTLYSVHLYNTQRFIKL
jgi:hypothetical protein